LSKLKAVKITEDVYWVGAIDWDIRDFHGYLTSRGTTYNAYLVMGEKITLVDCVKKEFKDVLISRISSLIDPEKIDYIVSNHAEMDHSGCLPEMIKLCKPEKVFASKMGVKALNEHFHIDLGLTEVKNGEVLNIGNMNLNFIETRMLHWPDSMVTYLAERKILFSQDAFGMHLASNERFDNQLETGILEYEGAKYFANILLPYSMQVGKSIEGILALNLDIEIIAPDHGPVWTEKRDWIINLYNKWAKQEPTKKLLVVYDTMWKSTEKMARAISDGAVSNGVNCKVMPLTSVHRSDIATEILTAGGLAVGSPTLNRNIYPTVIDALTYLKGLQPKNLVGGVFGSYGWSGEGDKQARAILEDMKIELVDENVRCKYVPSHEVLSQCSDLGAKLAQRIKEICE